MQNPRCIPTELTAHIRGSGGATIRRAEGKDMNTPNKVTRLNERPVDLINLVTIQKEVDKDCNTDYYTKTCDYSNSYKNSYICVFVCVCINDKYIKYNLIKSYLLLQ